MGGGGGRAQSRNFLTTQKGNKNKSKNRFRLSRGQSLTKNKVVRFDICAVWLKL